MKKILPFVVIVSLLALPLCAAQTENDGTDTEEEKKSFSIHSKAGESEVPPSKKPAPQSSERITDLDDTDPDGREKNADIIQFGLDDEVLDLLKTMTKNKDVRFVDEVYGLFQDTKNSAIKVNILDYFKTIEDPCFEDFAVMTLNDPYDEEPSVVNACFSYVQAVKTTGAIPAVEYLLENREEYFQGAIETLGKIGGGEEALYLTDYFNNEDLTLAKKQTLVRVLGQLKAVETYDALVEIAEDENENTFIRMYASQAIGEMGKAEAVDVLGELYSEKDPNLRAAVVKGLSNFDTAEAKNTLIQAIKDSHVKVRLEAVAAVKKQKMVEAMDFLIYRAKNDPEASVKTACYETIALLNTQTGNDYLIKQITDKKTGDATKIKIVKPLLENETGISEIASLALELATDDKRKSTRYAIGKEIAKYKNEQFADVCMAFLNSKDVSTQGTGLDMYAKGRYSKADAFVRELADKADPEAKSRNANAFKAAKILGIKVESKKD
ncbi:MAG: HEAT repeat domain-containing protein [Treponema sp.]|nr:HEAT repeat domain-containing protein [Treponema sp.]